MGEDIYVYMRFCVMHFNAEWYINGASMRFCRHLRANATTPRQIFSEKAINSRSHEHPLSLSS
jgi:hypothetical protein